ncbi:hypothetical protein [Aquisalibacillus elongatus]|uniref:Lipoprotein n=1 Tax=Aquisalibacillus elongatus TaxID=485577 RepID=A0A3N5AXR3_9BACI|nr:hypothetical protein [Aquisalibacillus elongatus]RPF50046.1 hypothetical protein EDC24_3083 [Aquisalibacillus elongatus]
MKSSIRSFILITLIILIGCTEQSEDEYQDIQEEIKDELGIDMKIIDPEDHTLVHTKLNDKGDDQVYKASLGFSSIEGEKEIVATDEEIESEEDSLNMEYIYGPYDGTVNFEITINREEIESFVGPDIGDYEVEELNNHDVYYQERSAYNELIAITFFDDVKYRLDINLDNIKKEEAFEYIEKIIDETS